MPYLAELAKEGVDHAYYQSAEEMLRENKYKLPAG